MGSTQTVEWVADAPGDRVFHCHKSHHIMNAMNHDLPGMIRVRPQGAEAGVCAVVPGYVAMGENGMGDVMDLGRTKNTLPMRAGEGRPGDVEGGMFTALKVRDGPMS